MAWTQSDLDAIDSAIQALITGGAVQSYTIGDRQLNHYSLFQLVALRKDVAAIVDEGTASGSTILLRTRPS
jgi:hypothetical protein